jgi:hypothetical protein
MRATFTLPLSQQYWVEGGANALAVEVHQAGKRLVSVAAGADLYLSVRGTLQEMPPILLVRGPYLQVHRVGWAVEACPAARAASAASLSSYTRPPVGSRRRDTAAIISATFPGRTCNVSAEGGGG